MKERARKNKTLAIWMASIVIAMTILAYASVPLFNLFCSITGYKGSNRAGTEAIIPGQRMFEVRFNADTMPNLPWSFKASQRKIKTLSGIRNLAFFEAKNKSNKITKGTAIFNILPAPAAKYFSKIECFCFEEQILKPGEKQTFPVSFYIDKEIANDPVLKNLETITLSYSFFASKK
jgi:cytochrome c oxidase assembly protein subunit 11